MDILDVFDEIKLCVAYKLQSKEIDYFPSSAAELSNVEVQYFYIFQFGSIL
jgi:adenylosuccinate synthase